MEKRKEKKRNEVPISDVMEKFISAKILDVDTRQMAVATVNGGATNHVQVKVHAVFIIRVVHVDGSPHGWVLTQLKP